ncbi:hypothetical protein D5125_15475 [Magnetovirga frankeli]|uniref:hypothetical protein n=1 Tax=Magnetovirga frankeli TaxID=947516 RepID=UPI001293AE1E|nr:hypothetical protein D5125_15475 [gamma proteobacterium SS-5]
MNKTPLLLVGTLLVGLGLPAQAMKCMPLYGNWCGPGHPPSGTLPAPVDEFDAACMQHDICTSMGPDTPCDVHFVNQLHALGAKYGYLPRPLQWAEYVIRIKAGGNPFSAMPTPTPWDAMGAMGSLATPCW